MKAALLGGGAAACGMVAGGIWPGRMGNTGSRHVVLVTIDTLRADRLGCYGYARSIGGAVDTPTPNLDSFAARGVLFENCTAQSNTTSTSMYSLFYSANPRYPSGPEDRIANGFLNWNTMNLYTSQSLLEVIKHSPAELGLFHTFAVHTNPYLDTGRFRKLFEYVSTPTPLPMSRNYCAAEQVNADALRAIRTFESLRREWRGPCRLFLHIHYMDVHGPDAVPRHFYEALGSAPLTLTDVPDSLRRKPEPYTEDEKALVASLNANYDARVMYMDKQIGALLDRLRSSSIFDDALIIVASDHGESLGEHGEFLHGGSMYQQEIHVPLILAGKNFPRGVRIASPVRNIDILQTVYEFYLAESGLKPWGDGRSLLPLCNGADRVERESYSWSPLTTLIDGKHIGALIDAERRLKYIVITDAQKAVCEMLFNLERDPAENTDISGRYPEHLLAMSKRFFEIRSSATPSQRKDTSEDVSPEVQQQLRALGYLN